MEHTDTNQASRRWLSNVVLLVMFALAGTVTWRWIGRAQLGRAAQPATATAPAALDEEVDLAAFDAEAEFAALPDAQSHRAHVAVTGRLVLVDASGREFPEESGQFTLRLRQGLQWARAVVAVDRGRWSLAADLGDERELWSVVAGGRRATFEPRAGIALESSGWVVRARWPEASRLCVVDAQSGVELGGLVLAVGRDSEEPGKGIWRRELLRDAPSPIELEAFAPRGPARAEPMLFWVRAQGWGWGRVLVDFDLGGERLLALARGCSLHVELDGPVPPSGARLRLESPEEPLRPDEEVTVQGPRAVLAGIAPGKYALVLDSAPTGGERLGALECEVVDRDLALVLPVSQATTPRKLVLHGTLSIPDAWGEPAGRLVIRSRQLPRSVIANEVATLELDPQGRRVWSAGERWPGRFDVELAGYGYRSTLLLEPTSEDPFRLAIPEPADVLVRISGAGAGEPRAPLRLEWGSPESADGRRHEILADATGAFCFRAPIGRVSMVLLDGDERSIWEREVELQPGAQEVLVDLEHTAGFELALFDGEVRLPWDEARYAWSARPLDSTEVLTARRARLELPEPGAYWVMLSPIAEFEAMDPLRVDVRAGERREVRIDLERRLREPLR